MKDDYPAALAWLYGTQLTGIKLGLDNIRRLLREATVFREGAAAILHVAGTNGKGSVCAMLDAVCRAGGRRTGLFTSPHLVEFRERIRLDGAMIPPAAVATGLTRLRNASSGWDAPPTFFELTTALALDWFAREGAEVIVLETGLGGRLDSTNVLTRPAACVLTAIDLDHTAWLGETLAAVAAEKAGILKPGVPAVSAPQAPEAASVIERVARETGAPLRFVRESAPADWPLALAGSHQRRNAALALAVLDAAGLAVPEAAARRGLANVEWPGRFQRLENGRVILDGAHNPAAARRLVETWREEFGPDVRATVVLGILKDKDVPAVCAGLVPLAARFIAVPVRSSPRSSTAGELLAVLHGVAPEIPAETADDLPAALAAARMHGGRVLVTGSLFLVGEALAQHAGVEPEQSWQ